jgi:hypothetical protein
MRLFFCDFWQSAGNHNTWPCSLSSSVSERSKCLFYLQECKMIYGVILLILNSKFFVVLPAF